MATDNNDVKDALYKRAIGYEATEITEEYVGDDDGGVRMVKKKVVSKNVPPDVSAVKLLVELDGEEDLKNLSDEELEKEKIRLLELLKKIENKEI